jgi:hypothetical protein
MILDFVKFLVTEYNVVVEKKNMGMWGDRCSFVRAVHSGYLSKSLKWELLNSSIFVDSGQCGIFSKQSYRNDLFGIEDGEGDFELSDDEPGDIFYSKMCQRTLSNQGWGVYRQGVVSSSGFGDGAYCLFIAKEKNKIVGMLVDFCLEEEFEAEVE